MRLLTLSDCPLVRHQGSGYVIVGFYDQLMERGWEIDLVGPDDLIWPRKFGTKGKRFRITFGMALRALKAHRAGAADIVLAYGEECWLAFRLLSRRAGRPRLVHHSNGLRAHLAKWRKEPPRPWWEPKTSEALTRADHVVVVSEFERSFAQKQYGLLTSRITAIPNSTELSPVAAEAPRVREVLFVGAWYRGKGTEEMIEAIPSFLLAHPDWTFRIVGADGPTAVRRLFPDELGSRILVEGIIRDRAEVAQRMALASIVLLPSHYESYGLVAAEAMMQGAIPVLTPVGLGFELTDGLDGFLFEPRSASSLCAALERALNAEAEWPRIAARGFDLVSPRTWSKAGDEMDRLLRQVIGDVVQ